MVEYRVEDLAQKAGISIELVRSYQSKGLLPQPRRRGRLAIYDDRHLDRLHTILDLKAQGYPLRMIAQLLERPEAETPGARLPGDEERLSLREVAHRSRVPPSMLRSLEASGVLQPRHGDPDNPYTDADVRAVRMLLSLISGGLPIEEFMRVARTQLEAGETVAAGAAELFLEYVRQPLLAAGLPAEQEAERLLEAFRVMLQATTTLIAYNFQRMVENQVHDEIEKRGSAAEKAAFREALRR